MDRAEAALFIQRLVDAPSIGGWKLSTYLGHGKSAVVMWGEKKNIRAAVKVFHTGLVERYGIETQRIRVARERSLIGRHHPNLVEILDGGECVETGYLFVVMEYVPGQSLSNALGKITRTEIPIIIEQLARAAKQLEDWEIIHRDIKPDNIQVSPDLSSIKLLDFGVIKPIGDNSATEQQPSRGFLGTHQYCPPEMIHGREDESVDGWRAITFYQLGAVLHDLILRKSLFADAAARTPAELVSAIDDAEVIVDSEDVDQSLCSLATRCLLKSPQDRIRLVAWEDFFISGQKEAPIDRKARREALTRRISLGSVRFLDPLEKSENTRLAAARLDSLVRSIRGQFDRSLIALAALVPSRSITVAADIHPAAALTAIFESDQKRGFEEAFHVQLAIEVQENSRVVRIFSRAGRGTEIQELGWSFIVESLDDFVGVDEIFEDWLLGVVEELIKN
jgi:serine/threonine protein kinase